MTFLEKVFFVVAIAAFLMITGVAKANPVLNWFEAEKNKTIEYQKESWEKGKVQLTKTKESILNLFNKVKTNVTQN